MEQIPFQIPAVKEGKSAPAGIVGTVGRASGSEEFRAQVDAPVKTGIRSVHVYVNSPGGSCFDASETVNILEAFEGGVTGGGGTTAACISLSCKRFEMPGNSMFMIHRPAGCAGGTVFGIWNCLKPVMAVESQYYDLYRGLPNRPSCLIPNGTPATGG